ncbi:LacI family DNA-binding transcriptional regulator [Pelagicoccus sp. SDUM812003]|uniref:LacI family DNA-binding transcriptional regulator n=1 Tax=Pelagicoccus sp. SDUM812003 TaxID=3041267 RepID=UPI00280E94F6|nr:LacI family DNA-binding transcriptional regulator [Pelagicoccus sp. SDUM812003]MDQ8204786.1 LacI family DNA-binding transcriptional regulator [Pelagicoccus sp. SDUM812003]
MAKLNQKLIADKLNLSRTTVSRCFTNHPKINPETRAKVFRLAAEMGYSYSAQRNGNNAKLAGRRKLAVIVGIGEKERDKNDTKTAEELLTGISEKAAIEKLEIEAFYVDPQSFLPQSRARQIIKGVSCLDWKGAILIYPLKEEAVSNIMAKFPTVSVLEDYDNCDVDCIHPDQIRGISRLMQRLVELGHRRIGFLSWKYPVHTPWVERRLGAYVENIYRFGLQLDQDIILNLRPEEQIPLDELAQRAAELTRQGVTAWVCAADHQAYHLIERFKSLGISVPEHCSITGFDGLAPPPGLPQVTSIHIPFRDIGISAISSLLRKIDHPNTSRRNIQVSGDMIIGETSGPPPKS